MNIRLIYILLFAFLLTSCKDDNAIELDIECEACGVKAPQINIEWLAEKIAELETAKDAQGNPVIISVDLAKYKKKDVFLISHGVHRSTMFDEALDCEGNSINTDDFESLKIIATIYVSYNKT